LLNLLEANSKVKAVALQESIFAAAILRESPGQRNAGWQQRWGRQQRDSWRMRPKHHSHIRTFLIRSTKELSRRLAYVRQQTRY